VWADFIAPGDAAWAEFLAATPHDFYHLPGYVELCARREGGEAAAFLVRDGEAAMLAPLVLRPIPGGTWRDATAPYGYPAPLLQGAPSPERIEAFLKAFAKTGAERGLVSAFFRFHPLLPLPPEPFAQAGTLVDHGETVYLDLELAPDELERQTRINHRADARKLLAKGFRVALDDWSRLGDFADIYLDTMRLHDAGAPYRFDAELFRAVGADACATDGVNAAKVIIDLIHQVKPS